VRHGPIDLITQSEQVNRKGTRYFKQVVQRKLAISNKLCKEQVYLRIASRVLRLEREAARPWSVLPFGIEAIDWHLPDGGPALGARCTKSRRQWRDRRRGGGCPPRASPRTRRAKPCGASLRACHRPSPALDLAAP
jgi:hypothetical protein